MTLIFYAQPYDNLVEGFYFRSIEEYDKNAADCKNSFNEPVEELEIQFIDGEGIDCELAKAWELNQASIEQFIQVTNDWDINEKRRFIIAVGECGYSVSLLADDSDSIDIDIYELDSLKELAYEFVEEGQFGEIPERIQHYLDYDAIGRDLEMDYVETTIDGTNLIYRSA